MFNKNLSVSHLHSKEVRTLIVLPFIPLHFLHSLHPFLTVSTLYRISSNACNHKDHMVIFPVRGEAMGFTVGELMGVRSEEERLAHYQCGGLGAYPRKKETKMRIACLAS